MSVHVPGEAISKFFTDTELVKELEHHLRQLPASIDLGDLNKSAFDRLLGSKDSPGFMLWDLIRGNRIHRKAGHDYVGMGATLTSKLLARKRPRLIPIWDSKVKEQLQLPHSGRHWEGMRHALTDDEGELTDRLTEIREKSDQPQISLLRTFDVAVWHYAKDPSDPWNRPQTGNESEPADDDGQIGDAADDVPDAEPQQK